MAKRKRGNGVTFAARSAAAKRGWQTRREREEREARRREREEGEEYLYEGPYWEQEYEWDY